MNTKELIIICVAIIIAGSIIAGAVYFGLNNNHEGNVVVNNSTNNTTNSTNMSHDNISVSDSKPVQKESTKQSNPKKSSSNIPEGYEYDGAAERYMKYDPNTNYIYDLEGNAYYDDRGD